MSNESPETGPIGGWPPLRRIGSRVEHEGRIATIRVDTYQEPDGAEVEREVIEHPGAVAVVAHDEQVVHLVRQPREAVEEPQLLELPAGKLDHPGEAPMECARRELLEETGIEADSWRELRSFYPSPGFAAETVHIFEATDLSRHEPDPGEGERVAAVAWPLERLEELLAVCRDGKTLIGLYELRDLLRGH